MKRGGPLRLPSFAQGSHWLFYFAGWGSLAMCALAVAGWAFAEYESRSAIPAGEIIHTHNVYVILLGGFTVSPLIVCAAFSILPAVWVGIRAREWWLDRARTRVGCCLTC